MKFKPTIFLTYCIIIALVIIVAKQGFIQNFASSLQSQSRSHAQNAGGNSIDNSNSSNSGSGNTSSDGSSGNVNTPPTSNTGGNDNGNSDSNSGSNNPNQSEPTPPPTPTISDQTITPTAKPSGPTVITKCGQTIRTPGTYIMNGSLNCTNGNGINFLAKASGSTLNCQGGGFVGVGNASKRGNYKTPYGINLNGTSNMTVMNCIVTNFAQNGLFVDGNGQHNTILDSGFFSNSSTGVYINSNSSYNTIIRTESSDNQGAYGYHIVSNNNTISSSTAYRNNFSGFRIDSSNNIFSNNISSDNHNDFGFLVLGSNNIFTGNTALNNPNKDFYINASQDVSSTGNTCGVGACVQGGAYNICLPNVSTTTGNCTEATSTSVLGCTDPYSTNYNSLATQDDGSCTLVGHWTLDDNAENTVVLDTSSSPVNGTSQQNTNLLSVLGQINTALHFNASVDYINTNQHFTVQNSFTITTWVKRERTGIQEHVFGQGGDIGIDRALHIGFRDDNTVFFAFYADDLAVPVAITDTNWHHMAFVFDSTNNSREVYIDGVLSASDTSAGVLNTNGNLLIGRSAFGHNFQGDIDDTRIYNTVLSSSTITDIYNSANPTHYMSACGSINISGTYQLTQDLSTIGGGCIAINADNVTLDGNGYTITGDSLFGSGISSSNHHDITIKNINITSFITGLQFSNVSSSTISSSTSNNNGYIGIYMNSSSYNTISNNITNSNAGYGVYLGGTSAYNILRGNSSFSNSGHDFNLENFAGPQDPSSYNSCSMGGCHQGGMFNICVPNQDATGNCAETPIEIYSENWSSYPINTILTSINGWTYTDQYGNSTSSVQTAPWGGNAIQLDARNGWTTIGYPGLSSTYTDLSARMKRGDQTWLTVRWDGTYTSFSPSHSYSVQFLNNAWYLYKIANDAGTVIASSSYTYNSDDFVGRIVADGSTLSVYINDILVGSATDSTYSSGAIALTESYPGIGYFDDIKVYNAPY